MSEDTLSEYIYQLAATGDTHFSAQSSGLFLFDGQQWQNALASLQTEPFAVTAVTLSPDYATDRTVFAGAAGVILRSMDGGASWEAVALPAPPPIITALAAAPDYASSGAVYAATLEDGVFVSTDRGTQWNAWNFGLIGCGVNTLLAEQGGRLYAGTELGLFQSTNAGRSWREMAVFDVPVTTCAQSDGSLWVGTEGAGLWQIRELTREQVSSVDTAGTIDTIVADGANLLVVCDSHLLLSRDSGITWHTLAPEWTVSAVAAIQGLTAGSTVLIGDADGAIQTVSLAE